MSNYNKVILMGRVGQDPEARHTQSGQQVANFSIAISEKWKDKQGERQEKTEWVNIVVWGNLATTVDNYVRKGKRVQVEGKLQTSNWTDNQNVKHYKTEVVANSIQIIDWPDDEQQGHQEPPQGAGGGQDTQRPAGQLEANQGYEEHYVVDDIPF